jgi:hypothetical protein
MDSYGMSKTRSCLDHYKDALDDRKSRPLPSGGYKLTEARRTLNACLNTLAAIQADKRYGGKFRGYRRSFGCCKSDDAAIWLKRLPGIVAAEMGSNVIPAIEALEADAVSKITVAQQTRTARAAATDLVDACEEASQALRKGGIEPEYRRLRQGSSTLEPLVRAALDIVNGGLGVIPASNHPPIINTTTHFHQVGAKSPWQPAQRGC